jgi:hypothetical protein
MSAAARRKAEVAAPGRKLKQGEGGEARPEMSIAE